MRHVGVVLLWVCACNFDAAGQGYGAPGPAANTSMGVATSEDDAMTSIDLDDGDSDTGATSTTGANETSDAGETTSATGGSRGDEDTDDTDDTQPALLVDDALLVRYYLDEQAQGEPVQPILDAGPNAPVDLVGYYAAGTMQPRFVTDDEHGGMRWTTAGGAGRVSQPVGSTAEQTKLSNIVGSTTMTIEVVLRIDAAWALSRIVTLERTGGGINLAFGARQTTGGLHYEIYRQGSSWAQWPASASRAVVHVIIDTELAPSDRLRGFVDGVAVAPTLLGPPPSGHTFGLNGDTALSLGNCFPLASGGPEDRAIGGTLYYAAIYAGALSDEQVAHNAAILMASDDSPP
jgi:hypothetical protein